jgi:hypothetical protein
MTLIILALRHHHVQAAPETKSASHNPTRTGIAQKQQWNPIAGGSRFVRLTAVAAAPNLAKVAVHGSRAARWSLFFTDHT